MSKPSTSPHIEQVRQSLLDTLADLRNREQPMDIERAKAVATVAGVLVDTARVENDYLKITGQDRSKFLEQPIDDTQRITTVASPFPQVGNITRHRLQG
jgi:hypothetical protein